MTLKKEIRSRDAYTLQCHTGFVNPAEVVFILNNSEFDSLSETGEFKLMQFVFIQFIGIYQIFHVQLKNQPTQIRAVVY